MENWGIVTFRQVYLLSDDGVRSLHSCHDTR